MHCSCLLVSSLSHTPSPSQPSRLFLLEIETHRTEGEIRKFGCLWVVSWFSVSCPAGFDRNFFRHNHNNSPLINFSIFLNLHKHTAYKFIGSIFYTKTPHRCFDISMKISQTQSTLLKQYKKLILLKIGIMIVN